MHAPNPSAHITTRVSKICAKFSRKAPKRTSSVKSKKRSQDNGAIVDADSPDPSPSEATEPTESSEAAPAVKVTLSVEEAICGEAVFPLPTVEWLPLRVRVDPGANPYDAVLEAAKALGDDEAAFEEFVAVNRDLVDYRFLYKLTAQLLHAEHTGDASSAEKRGLRFQLNKQALLFDQPLYYAIGEAESRLGKVLGQYQQGQKPSAATIVMAAGTTPTQIFSFWLVVVSALAAWESKIGMPSLREVVEARMADLFEVRDTIESRENLIAGGGLSGLAELVRLPSMWAPDADFAQARELMRSVVGVDEAAQLLLIRRIGCIHCQLQRHSAQSYAPMVQKMSGLQDVLLGGEPRYLVLEGTGKPPRAAPFKSRLVQLAYDADRALGDEHIIIPNF